MIEVTLQDSGDPMGFDVTLGNGRVHRYSVSMSRDDYRRLGAGHAPEAVVEAAFRFLLDREPPEAILSRFDLDVIPTYFPDFEEQLPAYLGER